MGWASNYIEKLHGGEAVKFRPRGNSMSGRIESGQLVTVVPLDDNEVKKGDIVLCTVKGKDYLHIVKAVKNDRYQIGNNKGLINGWIGRNQIHGKVDSIAA